MVGRAAADRRQPLPQPHGVDAAQPPRCLGQDAMGHGAEGLLRAAPDRRGGGRPDRLGRPRRPPSRLPRRRCSTSCPALRSGWRRCRNSRDRVGKVSAGFPCAGTPVVVGTMDAWGGMFGVGIHHPGRAMYLSGTSEILGIVSPSRVPTPGVIAFPTYDGITLHAGPTQSGGASMMWLGGLLGKDLDAALRPCRGARPGGARAAFPAASAGRAGAALGLPCARRVRRTRCQQRAGRISPNR